VDDINIIRTTLYLQTIAKLSMNFTLTVGGRRTNNGSKGAFGVKAFSIIVTTHQRK
jgi:hypothetical protein